MSARTKGEVPAADRRDEHINEVRLVGRVSQAPAERVLPSGDAVWTFRLAVTRTGDQGRSKQTVDALDCAVWAARPRRSILTWQVDDVVEVAGSVRRRFFRTGAGAASRTEVEVRSAKVIRRAGSG
ncbi:single-stranded DNA-binding protein [Nocardioides marmotae]|uniref:single-stranded DNA-binding protein n=1 Tax=Nocardioides marmotae TaxID=2663857 RepID=UPI0012B5051E|nr:single-stranded DNA-binding protein [Nocardioides marmotae]MBC9735476.1 single-stranded DNA-binding protein [Nocardioides marmotae]MTB86573.1 single-stranded DNA-binding protein [Nocardioides marmotae]